MDSLTSHFQSTSRAQRVRNDRIERGRITHKRMEDIHQHIRTPTHNTRTRTNTTVTLQDRARGTQGRGRKKKQAGGFRPGPWYYVINHPNLSRCHTIWACAGERRLYQFSFRATFDVLAPRRTPAVPLALSARAPAFTVAQPALSQFYNQVALPLPTGD